MTRKIFKVVAFALVISFVHSCSEPIMDETSADEMVLKSSDIAKTYIVVLNDNELNAELVQSVGYDKKLKAAQKATEKILKRAGLDDANVEFVYGTALTGFAVKIPPGQLKKLELDPSVSRIEEDQPVALIHPLKAKPGGGSTAPQSTPWGITRIGGATNFTGTGVAYIVDTGIDLDHPDLNVNALKGANFTSEKNLDDNNGHGSHVAGTVAAKNNTIGVIGVAAGATVVPVKVLNRSGSGTWSGVIAGIDFVAANGKPGDVANMSLGGSFSQSVNDAVIAAAQAGIKIALAAGNESTDAATKSPASANHANIYTISAMASGDLWASYSNYGNPPVDYCAPGSAIYSTYKGGGYATLSGTSMASPHVAGLLLLGNISTDGTVKNDPDGNPDPIAHK
jgi:subtilisin family serine protease